MPPRQYQNTMPKFSLEIGSRLLLNLAPLSSHKPVALQGEYVGSIHYEFMILKLPAIPGLAAKITPKMRIELSYQDQGAVNRFPAEILTTVAKPCFLLFVSYPDRITVTEIRKHQRTLCTLPVILASPHGDGQAVIVDLSRGGCKLCMELTGQSGMRQLMEGDHVILKTCFSANGESVRGIGIVRQTEITGSKLHVGLAFDQGHKNFSTALDGYLEVLSRVL